MKHTPLLRILTAAGCLLSLPLGVAAQHSFLDSYTGPETCLRCHAGADAEVAQTLHWTWEKTDEITGQEVGKINVINNYCVAVPSNEPRCTSCHAGIGWKDKSFDHSDLSQMDCLICHDQSGTYKKIPTGGGDPDPEVDLLTVAQSVGKPTRENCGICHFYGGGGEGVKHGSLDSSLVDPSRDLDVHMGGMGFDCTSCHVPDDDEPHMISGSRYSQAQPDNFACQSCHGAEPHSSGLTNNHASRVACQTCHIPAYARGGKATKMYWDWTTAGEKTPEGDLIVEKDADGNVLYHTKKGTFTWEENVVPEYRWFNGTVTWATLDDTVMQGEVVTMNVLHGDIADEKALIFPVKRFTGRQPYDAGAQTLAIPNLMPYPADDTDAYWKSYDWEKALSSGMAYVGREFVGPVGIIDTEMFWIQNHMVAPAENALKCADCHTYGSRMNFAQLGYAPERAEQLQLMAQEDFWAGYPVTPGGYVDTGDFMGWLYVGYAPWIYSVSLDGYAYIREAEVTDSGAWVYVLK